MPTMEQNERTAEIHSIKQIPTPIPDSILRRLQRPVEREGSPQLDGTTVYDNAPIESTYTQLLNITFETEDEELIFSQPSNFFCDPEPEIFPKDMPTLPVQFPPVLRTFSDGFDNELQDSLQLESTEETQVHTLSVASRHARQVEPGDIGRTLKLGSMVYRCPSETLELWPVSNIQSISKRGLLRVICGMLNTHENGVICLGVTDMGIISGIHLTREHRDQVRLGLDNFISFHIIPPLLPINVEVKFIPVISEPDKSGPVELYVIEINLFPSPFDIYTLADGTCFARKATATYEVGFREVHQMAIVEGTKLFLGTFHALEEEVGQCEEQLRKLLTIKTSHN